MHSSGIHTIQGLML